MSRFLGLLAVGGFAAVLAGCGGENEISPAAGYADCVDLNGTVYDGNGQTYPDSGTNPCDNPTNPFVPR